jgi:hypothetical protein
MTVTMFAATLAGLSAPARSAGHPAGGGGFFDGFGWSEAATIIAAVFAAAIAAAIAVAGYSYQRKAARRAERATQYGDAIAAVEDYLEGPYRIRRKNDQHATWFAISSQLSDAKAAISKHTAQLEMHAPDSVVTAYKAFVAAALAEAGPQMTAAWNANPIISHTDVPLGAGYDRSNADSARAALVTAMKADLRQLG